MPDRAVACRLLHRWKWLCRNRASLSRSGPGLSPAAMPPGGPGREPLMMRMAMATSGNGPTDAALVIQAQRGAVEALEMLFRRHAPRVRALALALMGKDSDLDDLVQDSFTQPLQSLNNLKLPPPSPSCLP